jgi:hypothetical protein
LLHVCETNARTRKLDQQCALFANIDRRHHPTIRPGNVLKIPIEWQVINRKLEIAIERIGLIHALLRWQGRAPGSRRQLKIFVVDQAIEIGSQLVFRRWILRIIQSRIELDQSRLIGQTRRQSRQEPRAPGRRGRKESGQGFECPRIDGE